MLNMYEQTNIPTPIEINIQDIKLPTEDSLSYLSQYERETPTINSCENKKASFRKEHCKKGHLVSKQQNIRTDMTEHVFPEVSYVSDKCNICNSTCDFTVSERIISTGVKEGFAQVSCRN